MQKINIFYVQEVLLCELLSLRTTQIHETTYSLHRKTYQMSIKIRWKAQALYEKYLEERKNTF